MASLYSFPIPSTAASTTSVWTSLLGRCPVLRVYTLTPGSTPATGQNMLNVRNLLPHLPPHPPLPLKPRQQLLLLQHPPPPRSLQTPQQPLSIQLRLLPLQPPPLPLQPPPARPLP